MQNVLQTITRTAGKKTLQLKKNSPHLFFAAGVVGIVGTTILACRATLKLEETVDEIKDDLKNTTASKSNIGVTITEQDYYGDLAHVYLKSAGKLIKLYGPAVLVGTASVTALTGSHVQLSRRNSALTFTLAAVSEAYDKYRERVIEELGEKRELELRNDIREIEQVDEKGRHKIVKEAGDPNQYSIYAQLFDAANPNWKNNSEYNRIFLQMQQNYFNHILQARGHVFLNEVYDALGFEHTTPGAVVGWVIGPNGDNYINFHIFEAESNSFLQGKEKNIWLDFNVDGVVYDKI